MKTSSNSFFGSSRRRLGLGLAFASFVPWTVLMYPDGVRFVFAWGLVNPQPLHVTTVVEYFASTQGLPRRLLAWPIAGVLYACALASIGFGLAYREDRELTAGLLGLAGVSNGWFALGLLARSNATVLPIALVVLVGAALVTFRNRR